ncbi:hypothetical protein [Streptomyces sp. NPDC048650]|uniref:hypothetical protein n=1 Tax=unclassified Streptomyces TaxID=2593676 RepID=UPI00371869AB
MDATVFPVSAGAEPAPQAGCALVVLGLLGPAVVLVGQEQGALLAGRFARWLVATQEPDEEAGGAP